MSFHSFTRSGDFNDDGRTSRTDESSSSESSDSKETERQTSGDESTQTENFKHAENQSEEARSKTFIQTSNDTKMKGYLNKDYRDLLNSAIDGAAGVPDSASDDLPSSYIGPALWSSKEKETFFHALSTKGRDDLPNISRAVGTKHEIEVRSYLLHLQTICSEGQGSPSPAEDNSVLDIPASLEIGEKCEQAISLTAEALGRHVLQHDIELEKQKFGDLWLIDDEIAAKIENEVERKEKEAEQKERRLAIDAAGSHAETSDNGDVDVGSGAVHEEKAGLPDKSGSGTSNINIIDDIAAAEFLKAEAFLQLSRSLFMNSAVDPECNWSQVGPASGGFAEPAMFRSAFDNFHHIAVNFTRWLVQATAFQTMSRVRAKDDQNPKAIMTTEDVKTALDILNISFDREKYWAGVARRSGVDVFSESKKYKDGRQGTKNGWLITWDEAETELGYAPTEASSGSVNAIKKEASDSEDSSQHETSSADDLDSEGSSEDDADAQATTKRRRYLNDLSDEDKEDEHLDDMDKRASRAEERRLMEMLRYTVWARAQSETGSEYEGDMRRKRARTYKNDDWRDHINYVAEWEQRGSLREKDGSEEKGRE